MSLTPYYTAPHGTEYIGGVLDHPFTGNVTLFAAASSEEGSAAVGLILTADDAERLALDLIRKAGEARG